MSTQVVEDAYSKAHEVFLEAEEKMTRPISAVVLLCSGGNDSVVSSHVSDRLIPCMIRRGYLRRFPDPWPLVCYMNTKIGIAANRDFVYRYTATHFGESRFREYVTPESYEKWCFMHGFPGPSAHRWMYIRLKERCIKQLIRDQTFSVERKVLDEIINDLLHLPLMAQQMILLQILASYRRAHAARQEQIVFITGVRSQESARRAQTVSPVQVRGREIWVSPLANWSKQEVLDVKEEARLPRNEVADTLHRSKDCLCGAYAHAGELAEICFWYPEEGAYLLDLQKRVMAAGFPWGWEQSPPTSWNEQKKGQMLLPWPIEQEHDLQEPTEKEAFFPLCSTCFIHQEEEKETTYAQ